jgi:hypothetical protein
MTAERWDACGDPADMLRLLEGRASERKLRLFATACCRQPAFVYHLRSRDEAAVDVAERYADGQADRDELRLAGQQAQTLGPTCCCEPGARLAAYRWVDWVYRPPSSAPDRRRVAAGLLGDIFGNPFLTVPIDPAWRSWHGGVLVGLAQAAYENRHLPLGHLDNTHLLVLADALEEVGCAEPQILGHLRSGGAHVRGCFVVDAVLGKS